MAKARLTAEFGPGYTEKGLRRMIQFAKSFPDGAIVSAPSAQLGWSHFVELIALDDQPAPPRRKTGKTPEGLPE